MSKALRFAMLSGLLFAAGAEVGAAAAADFKVPARLKAAEKDLLTKIHEGGDTGITVPDETAPEFVTLLKAGWLETNPNTRQTANGVTSIIARLSASGKTKVEAFRGPRSPDIVNTRPPADFVAVEEDYDLSKLPVSTRQVRAVYALDTLSAPGKSLWYPAPEDFPAEKDFAETKAGTVTGYNRKAKTAFEATDPATRPPGAVAASYKAINDTKDGKRGVRFIRVA